MSWFPAQSLTPVKLTDSRISKQKSIQEKKAVLLFDTEQSAADQQYNVTTILKRAGLEDTPDFLRCYNIRQLDFKTYRDTTNAICDLSSKKFGGIHSIYIDGGADFIASVNDEEQSTEIIQYFTHLSIKYDCPVIIVVHQNPGGEKERGHFGSTGQRKCYGLIAIEKQNDIFSLKPKMMRRAGNAEISQVQFSFSAAKGEKNRIQDQIDLLDKKSDHEIELIERSTLSEQDKADRISVIEARRDSQRQLLEMRQREAEKRKARFEKAAAIANIVMSTAVAVVKALGSSIPLALLTAALGAAQLAVAIATPIPEYKLGTKRDGHPGGPTILGDGGREEFVRLPSGKAFISPSKNTLYDLPKGTHVFPDANKYIDQMGKLGLSSKLHGSPGEKHEVAAIMGMSESLSRELKLTRATIKDKKELHISGSEVGMAMLWRHGADRMKYIEEQVKFKR
jgi:hypothetical protein